MTTLSANDATVSTGSQEEEQIAKIIFLRLEPTIGLLLNVIRRYQSTVGSADKEELISMLQAQSKLLQQLHVVIPSLGSDYHLSPGQVSRSLALLADYLLLPILAVIKCTRLLWNGEGDQNDATVRSASFKTVQSSAAALVDVVKTIGDRLPLEKTMQCLIACAVVLPSDQGLRKRNKETALDRGEHCLGGILQAITCLVCNGDRPDQRGSFIKMWEQAMNGALLARLVDCIVTMVEPPSTTLSISNTSSRNDTEIQAQALAALEALIEHVPSAGMWQRLFPGTFAGLYRNILQSLGVAHNSSRVTVLALQNVCSLLRLVLPSANHPTQKAESVISKLKALPPVPKTDISTSVQQEPSASGFYSKAKQMLPGTLTVLVHMLYTARTDAVREVGTSFIRIILVDSVLFWDEELLTAALEACLVLSLDDSDAVSAAAKAVLNDHQPSSGGISTAPRIIELIDSLPALVKASKEVELAATLKLISSYLNWSAKSKGHKKKVRSNLTSEKAIESIRHSCTALFNITTSEESNIPLGRESGTNAVSLVLLDGRADMNRPSNVHLSEYNRRLAYSTIGSLAQALGSRSTAVIVDACIADIYESCVARLESGVTLDGPGQRTWANSCIGTITLSEHLIRGGFVPLRTTNSTKERAQKHLQTLSSSVIPLVTTYPLWELPVNSSVVQKHSPSEMTDLLAANVTHVAFPANAQFTIALLHLVGCIVQCMEQGAVDVVPAVLLPILEKCNSQHRGVADTAQEVLTGVAHSLGLTSTKNLVFRYTNSLLGSLLSRIRVPGGKRLQGNVALDSQTLKVADITCLLFQSASQSRQEADLAPPSLDAMTEASMEELVREIVDRFDRSSAKLRHDLDGSAAFLRLCQSIAGYLISRNLFFDDSKDTKQDESSTQPWFGLLERFERVPISARAGFSECLEDKTRKEDVAQVNEEYGRLQRETDFIAVVVQRACYMLSHRSLTIEIQSCDVLIDCFRFLARVASVPPPKVSEEIANGPNNAILRQIHSAWPSISARLKAVSSEIKVGRSVSLIIAPVSHGDSQVNIGEKRIFLSKLLNLIATMTESSDDFMSRMFRSIVWPVMGEVLADLLKSEKSSANMLLTEEGVKENLAESEQALLIAVMDCLRRIFAHRPTGLALAGLIPSIGAILFPFLEHEMEDISMACIETVRSLVRIDCDALWRPLLEMSGQRLAPCPLKLRKEKGQSEEDVLVKDLTPSKSDTISSASLKSARIAESLMTFIESLPEQEIE